jgi:Phage Tail Collar Domain
MALRIADRIRETSTTTGTGTYTLGGAWPGFRTMASVLTVDGDTAHFTITDGTNWEVILGTRTSATNLARTTILASSNAGSAVNWPAGTKDIFSTVPASYVEALGAARKAVGEITQFPKDPGTSTVARGGVATGAELFVECDGALYNIATFPALGAYLGVSFGGNGITTFGMPNTKDSGRFLRSRDAATTLGASQTNQNKNHNHPSSVITNGAGTCSGTTGGADRDHSHGWGGTFTTGGASADHDHTASGGQAFIIANNEGFINYQSGGVGGFGQRNNTSGHSNDHSHNVSVGGTTGGQSQSHLHGFNGSTALSNNALTITNDGGTEARPEAFIVMTTLKT